MYLRLTLGIASASAVGLAILLPYINFALFKDGAGNSALVLFVFAVALMAAIQAYQSIQQSRNQFRVGIYAAGCGLLLKGLLTWPLTYLLGTTGASLSTLLGLIGTLIYFVFSEKKALNSFWIEQGYGKKLLLCLGIMACVLFLYYGVITLLSGGPVTKRLQALIFCLGGVFFGGTVFIIMALKVKLLTIREWLLVPFGKKLLKLRGGKNEIR